MHAQKLKQCFAGVEREELKVGETYDTVVRLRPDTFFYQPLSWLKWGQGLLTSFHLARADLLKAVLCSRTAQSVARAERMLPPPPHPPRGPARKRASASLNQQAA